MNVCVEGLWHLGTVTAACLASGGHHVIGLDFDEHVIANLNQGIPPLYEPRLEELVKEGLETKHLSFTTSSAEALKEAEILWITYDTPVDEDDHADVAYVEGRIKQIAAEIPSNAIVLISSQVPVGTTHRLEEWFARTHPNQSISFAYSPENLRLGKAINVFTKPDRVVVGARSEADQERIAALLHPFTDHIEWMSVESAEMTKHALNAFLAVSVTFINEIASVCEKVGADAKEVERGLKTESRIGSKAYLGPGGAFAGGTLARDIAFLTKLCQDHGLSGELLNAVAASNTDHKNWPSRRLTDILGSLKEKTIAVWGLTYKPGTDTLRRSTAIELCRWLLQQGAQVKAHDPVVKTLPTDLVDRVSLCATPLEALQNADALVVATEWPDYASIPPVDVMEKMKSPNIIDANRFLGKTLGTDPYIHLFSVGKAP
jgi:UDPglucose 6-dehydrogenase